MVGWSILLVDWQQQSLALCVLQEHHQLVGLDHSNSTQERLFHAEEIVK